MQAKGTPHAHFQRAVERGNVVAALAAARQLPRQIGLADALALCVLLAEADPERFRIAAPRWHARYVLELPHVTIEESQLVLAAVASLAAEGVGSLTLQAVADRRRLFGFESALRRFKRD